MAGTIHEVDDLNVVRQIKQDAVNAAEQLVRAAKLKKGDIVVVGCSTSETLGKKVGSWSVPEVGMAIYEGLDSVFSPLGIYLPLSVVNT